jgi:hypothetical protein
VVDKRDLLVVVGGKLFRCAVEYRFGHLEEIDSRPYPSARSR